MPQIIEAVCAWGGAWDSNGERRRRPRTAALAARYDRAACFWQRRYIDRWGFPRAYAAFWRRLAADGLLPAADSLRVLDCGIGTAAFSAALAETNAVSHLHGADASSGMLREAGRNLAARGVASSLCRADIHRLPYASGAFDVVLCAHLLEHLPAPWLGIRELVRVLRPEGLLAIVATRANPVDLPTRFRWRYAPLAPPALGTWLAWAGCGEPRYYRLGSAARLPFWLSRAVVARRKRHRDRPRFLRVAHPRLGRCQRQQPLPQRFGGITP